MPRLVFCVWLIKDNINENTFLAISRDGLSRVGYAYELSRSVDLQ